MNFWQKPNRMISRLVWQSVAVTLLSLANVSSAAVPVNAQQLLKNMLPSECYFAGTFEQLKQLKGLPKPLRSSGRFLYSCQLGLIWESNTPLQEALVFTTDKLNFLVSDKVGSENLESVQHDFLANLLLGLMAADTKFLEQEFTLSATNNTLSLQPKGEMIKDAINSITLEKPTDKQALVIRIIDNKQQLTKINTQQVQRFDNDKDYKQRCATQAYLSNACELLLNPERIIDK